MALRSKLSRYKIREVLLQAEEYAAAAVEGVLDRLDEDLRRPNRLFRRYARLVLALEVHFLFPNLTASERRLLVELLQTRNALAMRWVAKGSADVAVPARWTRLLSPWQRKLRQAQAQARRLSQGRRLTPIQKQILRQVFLKATSH